MPSKVCLGLGFGDECKGRVVDYLCRKARGIPRVVRFNGGHQAAHHVVHKDVDHVFAHFGSGTFQGAPTYWTEFCPVSPTALLNEREILVNKMKKLDCGPAPRLVIDRFAPITTPWDRVNNQQGVEMSHGSCGVGIRSTWKREEAGYHLWFEDLYHPQVFKQKLYALGSQYGGYSGLYTEKLGEALDRFEKDCQELAETRGVEMGESLHEFQVFPAIPSPGVEMLFEGAQGLMLDAQFGFMPYVTPSRTGTANLMHLRQFDAELFLVTRAYATRHGNGPFVPFEGEFALKKNPWESNFDGGAQGKFRIGPLSLDYLRYAVKKDRFLASHLEDATLVITCVDLLEEFVVSNYGQRVKYSNAYDMFDVIAKAIGVKKVLLSNSAMSNAEMLDFSDNR